MGAPSDFPQANLVLNGAPGSDVLPLPVYRDNHQVISRWELTVEERMAVAHSGVVWLHVMGPTTLPVCVSGLSPFAPQEDAQGQLLMNFDSNPSERI